MQPIFAKVSSKGQLVIPSGMRDELGIQAGTRVALRIEGSRIVLQPVTTRLVDELCGITEGGPSMTDDLLADRRAEHKRWEQETEAWLQKSRHEEASDEAAV